MNSFNMISRRIYAGKRVYYCTLQDTANRLAIYFRDYRLNIQCYYDHFNFNYVIVLNTDKKVPF